VTPADLPRPNGRYRLLACDIDDTLVRFPDPPSPRVTQAIQAAVAAGVTVVLVTGRAYRRAQPIAQAMGLTTPIIYNHSSVIHNAVDGTTIHRKTLPRALTIEVVTWLQTQNVCILLFDGDQVYRDCLPEQVVADFRVYTGGPHSTYAPDLRTLVPEQTEIVLAASRDRERLVEVCAYAQARWGGAVRVLYSHPFGVDVMPQGSKSEALAWLSGQLGVAREEVMAAGDGVNDADMLAWAGLGVAMGDGVPQARAAADVIAPPFDQDGAAWAIEHYLLR
jgi:Cof subfamily protein (haloacid dehalogenase superfamily)